MKYLLSALCIVLMLISVLFIIENIFGDYVWFTFIPSVIYLVIFIAVFQFLKTKGKEWQGNQK